MKQFKIFSKETGVGFGTFQGETETEALHNFAREAGYCDYYNLVSNVDGISRKDLEIYELGTKLK